LAGGVIYLSAGDGLYALRTQDGAVLWQAQAGADGSYSAPAVVNGIVYVSTVTGALLARRATDGKLLWRESVIPAATAPSSSPLSNPVVANNIVYTTTLQDGVVSALDGQNGHLLWSFAASSSGLSSPPVLADDVLYFTSGVDLYALQAAVGSSIWQAQIATADQFTPPVVGSGIVAVGTRDQVSVWDAANGMPLWQSTAHNGPLSLPVAVADGVVYTGAEGGLVGGCGTFGYAPDTVSALAARSGKLLWRQLIL
jgi:outer membrane protein assembly factor BamB